MHRTLGILVLLAVGGAPATRAQIPAADHVVIVILENHDYSQIIGSAAAPYINALVDDPYAALFTQSVGLTHPSQPNYLHLYSGSNQGVTNDNLPANLPFTTPNLGAALLEAGRTFVGYSEGLPSVGYNGTVSGNYARKHNPWVNWQDAPTHGVPATLNVPLTSWPADFDSLPTLSFVIPDQVNDMHNGSDPARITIGDAWVQTHLDPFVQWAKTHHGLFVLTFDENNSSAGNHIVTIFLGQDVLHGQYAEPITHHDVLRTLEDMYGLPPSGEAATAAPITDCWVTATSSGRGIPRAGEGAALQPATPNPFRARTTIGFSVPEGGGGRALLQVLDVRGRRVATLLDGDVGVGSHATSFDATAVGPGVYFYSLRIGSATLTRKMIVTR